jgi:hypothetical protein
MVEECFHGALRPLNGEVLKPQAGYALPDAELTVIPRGDQI